MSAALLVTLAAPRGAAAAFDGAIEPWGCLQTQNIVRHPDIDEFHFVQQRNTLRLGVRAGLSSHAPGVAAAIDEAALTIAYRGVYDSIYDYTPIVRERDLRGRKPSRAAQRDLGDLSRRERDALKFSSDLRAAFVDLRTVTGLRLRLGKQQLVWGEADLFRMLDRANPLDTSWHSVEEIPPPAFGWDDLRIPLWMLDVEYAAGNLGPLRDVHAEVYWNPGDWRPMKVAFLPRPWGIRLLNPLTNREDGIFTAPFGNVRRLAHSSLFRQGDYRRTPAENSQVGVRLSWTLANGMRAGLYYFHQRWAGDDGTPVAVLRGIPDTPAGRLRTQESIARGTLPVEYRAPYIHTVGASTSQYFSSINATLRLETVYDLALPMFDRGEATTLAPFLPGTSKRDFWKGMVAFDRPFGVGVIDPGASVFVTAQAFVHHLMHNAVSLTGPLDLPTAGARGRPFCGGPPNEPCTDPSGNGSFRDDVRSWESLITVAAFTTVAAGRVVPVLGAVVDPVNSYSVNAFWSLGWAIGSALTIDVTQRYFVTAQGDVQKGPFTPWIFGTMRGRSETALRLTHVF